MDRERDFYQYEQLAVRKVSAYDIRVLRDDPSDGKTRKPLVHFYFDDSGVSQLVDARSLLPITDSWAYVVGVYDGENVSIYLDGVLQESTPKPEAVFVQNDNEIRLGDSHTGYLDEVRVSTIARERGWIMAQYLSMSGNFVTYGKVESCR